MPGRSGERGSDRAQPVDALSESTAMEPMRDDFDRAFKPLEQLNQRSLELGRRGPSPGSRAARDGRAALGKIAWDLAGPAHAVGIDHLVAWRMLRLKAGIQSGFAHLTLLRGALEGTAIARWLCDQSIGTDERTRRAAGVQLADFEQRLRFERRMADRLQKPTGGAKTAVQRIEALQRVLRKQQVKPIGMPSATDLFARFVLPSDPEQLAGESLYRLVSGIAHAKVWSLYALSELGETIEHHGGRLAVRVTANDELALGATAIAMRIAREALEDLEWYAGPPATG